MWVCGCAGILLLASVLRLYHLDVPVIWYDEGFSIALSSLAPGQILFHTARDVHPPLYYLVLHGWMALMGDSVQSVRGLSVATGISIVGLGMAVAQQVAGRRAALIAGLLLAVLPIAVRYSQEVRMYSLLTLLLLAATLALLLWVRQPQRQRYLWVYGLLMLAALYTHYFAIWCVIAHWLYVLWLPASAEGRLSSHRSWWLTNALVALAFTPWLPALLRQITYTKLVDWIPTATLATIPASLWQFFTLDNGENLGWPLFVLPLLAMVAVSIVVVDSDARRRKPAALLVSASWVPLVLVWLASFRFPMFVERYLVFSAVGLAIMLALALDRLGERRRGWAAVLLVCCVAGQVPGVARVYSQKNTLNDAAGWYANRMDAVLGRVNSQWQPGDVMVVDGLYWYFSVTYYNRTGSEPLLYDNGAKGDSSGTSRTSFGGATLLYPRADKLYVADPGLLAPGSGRVWWIGGVPDDGKERTLPGHWRKIAEVTEGATRAMLFDVTPLAGSRTVPR